MDGVPRAFFKRLTSHNRHVLLGAVLSLVGAIAAWGAIYWGARMLILFLLTAAYGEAAQLPEHFYYIFMGVIVLLLTLAAVDRAFNPFPTPTDRPIFGLHLIKEIALMPALLTFAIYDNLNAYQRISPRLVADAWRLFKEIDSRGKVSYFEVNLLEEAGPKTQALLLLLQFAGLLDLHRGEEEWFYLIPSSEQEFCAQLKAEAGA